MNHQGFWGCPTSSFAAALAWASCHGSHSIRWFIAHFPKSTAILTQRHGKICIYGNVYQQYGFIHKPNRLSGNNHIVVYHQVSMIYHFCCFLGGKLMICPIYVSHALHALRWSSCHFTASLASSICGRSDWAWKMEPSWTRMVWFSRGSILFQRGSKTVWNIIKSNIEHVWTPLQVHTIHTVVVSCLLFDTPIERKECFVNRSSWATLQLFLLHFAWGLLCSHPNRVACCKACYSTRLVR